VAADVNVFVIKGQIQTIVVIVLPHILGEERHPEDEDDNNNNNQLTIIYIFLIFHI